MKSLLITTAVIAAIGLVGYLARNRADDSMSAMQMSVTENNSDNVEEMDLSGIHIMGDGSVMLGDGTVVPEATINADGMIVLPDGRLVEPAMDMRQ